MVDGTLAQRGLTRRVARSYPSFLSALYAASQSDHVLTAPERIARLAAPLFGLRVVESPVEISPYALSLLWHRRVDDDPITREVRQMITTIADRLSGARDPGARRRLDRQPRRRARTRTP